MTEQTDEEFTADIESQRAKFVKQRKIAATENSNALQRTVSDAIAASKRSIGELVMTSQMPPPRGEGGLVTAEFGDIARMVRIGSIVRPSGRGFNTDVEIPLLIPMMDTGNFVVFSGDSTSTNRARSLAVTVAHLALRGTAPGQLLLDVVDPTLSGVMAPFGKLGEAGANMSPTQAVDAPSIRKILESLTRVIAENSALLQGQWESIGDFVADREGEDLRPFHLLSILDYPRGFDTASREALELLMKRGPQLGVSVVVHCESDGGEDQGWLIAESARNLKVGVYSLVGGLNDLPVKLVSEPTPSNIRELCSEIATRAKEAARPTIRLNSVTASGDEMWRSSSADGMTAVIGRRGADPVAITLGDSIENLHNMLVGGSVGSGKSNLLLTLIYSLASRYSPEEVSMYLLDFKEGVEFARFCEPDTYLPHAKFVGIESDQEVGNAVLKSLKSELEQRSTLFKAAGATNLSSYRHKTGAVLARLLVVVDEFQVMIDDSMPMGKRNVMLLEDLSRRGRSFGIHLVLSSQTLTGLSSLADRKNAIFGQFPVRIALKTSPRESEIILDNGNQAASELRYRGEAVLNTNFGHVVANVRFVVAYAEESALDRLDRVFHAEDILAEPMVVRAGELAAYSDSSEEDFVGAVLGEPLAPGLSPIKVPVEHGIIPSLVVVGDGVPEAVGILHGAARSLAAGLDAGEFILIDAGPDQLRSIFDPTRLARELERAGHSVRIVEEEADLEEALTEPGQSRKIVVGPSMDFFDITAASSFSTPTNALQRTLSNNSNSKATLLLWYRSLNSAEGQLGTDWLKKVRYRVVLKSDARSTESLVGRITQATWSMQSGRAGFVDSASGEGLRLFTPFAPLGTAQGREDDE